jgi:hypothetical protein
VVIINADQAWLTGNKYKAKKYYSYTGYPSGITEKTAKQIGKSAAIEAAIKGMLPKNKLQAERIKRLRVFADANHAHTAQNPVQLVIKARHSGLDPESRQESHGPRIKSGVTQQSIELRVEPGETATGMNKETK